MIIFPTPHAFRPASQVGPSRHRMRGQAILEFALVLPVLLVLTVGLVDLARVYAANIALINAVREGALYAAMETYEKWCADGGAIPCPSGTNAANKAADPDNIAYRMALEGVGLDLSDLVLSIPECTPDADASFTTSVSCTTLDEGIKHVRLSATYDVPLITPVLSDLFGGSVHLSAATVAKVVA